MDMERKDSFTFSNSMILREFATLLQGNAFAVFREKRLNAPESAVCYNKKQL